MAITYTQTDGAADCGAIQACATGTIASTTLSTELIEGGTAGTTEQTTAIPAASSRLTLFMQTSGGVGEATWDSGTYTVRFNVTTAQANTTLTGVWVCRVDNTCTSVASIASNTGLNTDISGGGVFTVNLSGIEHTGTDTDDIYIVARFANSHSHTSRSVGITPNQNIDVPIVSTGPVETTADVGQLTVSGQDPSWTGGAPDPTVVIDSFEDENITEWTNDFDGTDFGFRTTGSGIVDGTVALEGGTNGGTARIYAGDGDLDGLPIGVGTEWRYWVSTNSADGAVKSRVVTGFGATTDTALASQEGYAVEFEYGDQDIIIERWDAGASTSIGSTTFAFATGTDYLVRIVWDDGSLGGSNGDITVELYTTPPEDSGTPVATATANDTTYTAAGGVSLQTDLDPGVLATWDYLHIPGEDTAEQTLSADVGTVTLSGPEASVTGDGVASTTADVGVLTATGQDASATVGPVSVTADAGQLTATGQEAAVAVDTAPLTADVGQLTAVGEEASTAVGEVTTTADTGALSLSGQEAAAAVDTAPLSADAGSLNLSGQEAATAVDTAPLSADVGQLSVTGPEASVTAEGAPQTLNADVGVLTVTGQDASASVGAVTVSADTGSLSLQGPEPVTAVDTAPLSADVGALTAAGQEAQIAGTGTASMTADVGQATLVGPEATLTAGAAPQTLSADVGQLTATGAEASVAVGEVSTTADAGTLTAVGEEASTTAVGTAPLSADVGQTTLVGPEATLTAGAAPQSLTADVGTVTLSGAEASVSGTGTVSTTSDAGVLTATGQEAQIAVDTAPLSADVGQLTADGAEASLTVGAAPQSLTADTGTLTATAPEPTATATGSTAITAEVGALSLAGPEAAVAVGALTISADVGVLSVTAADPTAAVAGSASLTADVGQLVGVGSDPTLTPADAPLSASVGTVTLTGPEARLVQGTLSGRRSAFGDKVQGIGVGANKVVLVGDSARRAVTKPGNVVTDVEDTD